jgi:carboxypeptidase Q
MHIVGQRSLYCILGITAAALASGGTAALGQSEDLAEQYGDVAGRIIDAAVGDSSAYQRLAELVDRFGHRFSGSESLERAIDWILGEMRQDSLENVRGEPVMVPHWIRGAESAALVKPRALNLPVLGLGGSVGTGRDGINAEVLVVRSFEELTERAAEAAGKIVLFNAPFTTYGETVQYRSRGAIEAARVGAVASLIRSVTPYSMRTPHTGGMYYAEDVRQIPHAAITVEDAGLLQRMQDRGDRIVVRLYMEGRMLPEVRSRNVVAEITGSENPEEIVVLGGHIDSWDVGQGAMDDAGGCVAAWQVLRVMQKLGLRPRRTVRVVLWTNEEIGLRGGQGYRDAHVDELDNHVLAMETDGGVFEPEALGFTGSDAAFELIQDVGRLLEPLGVKVSRGGGGADIGPLMREGVPGMGLQVDGSRYFWYHHTEADTIDKLDPREMALCVAAMAVMTYVVADMEQRLPRE